jgi:hypothetical protein
MSHYCGIDLHSNNHVVVVIDDEDKRVLEKRLNNDLSLTLKALSPYQDTLHGVAVESPEFQATVFNPGRYPALVSRR